MLRESTFVLIDFTWFIASLISLCKLITFKSWSLLIFQKYFEPAKPFVFAGLYPIDTDKFEELRDALERLQLNDSSISFEPESSAALGSGFRTGFLGMLHMEVIKERLEREFNLDLIATAPTVVYKVLTMGGEELMIQNPYDLPPVNKIDVISEPYEKRLF